MNFRTAVPIKESVSKIGYESALLSLGSCFAVNIAEKLSYFGFQNVVNPSGILFQPCAISKFLSDALSAKEFTAEDIFYDRERWHCFDAHSDLSSPDQNGLLQKLNAAAAQTKIKVTEASHIIITLGTAWVYRNNSSGNLVANCHKVPQKEFTKELLSVEMITDSLRNIIAMITRANPSVQIIFTVSPVRHIKDGFTENQRSKSHLISALHSVIEHFSAAHYFPSYEIMMDELRDYRFYAEDMIHPNRVAIDYIWERFTDSWISPEAIPIMAEVGGIRKAESHWPFDPATSQHIGFKTRIAEKKQLLLARHPSINF
ncbi:MAG TPA: GSCFA domain-containing protein [Flavobacterium sp.]|jgi:hypothetical protein